MRQLLVLLMLLFASNSFIELTAQRSSDTSKEWRKYVKEKRKAEQKARKEQRKRDKKARKEAAKRKKEERKRLSKDRAARKSKTQRSSKSNRSSKKSTAKKSNKAKPRKSQSSVVKEALKHRGVKYRYGGESPSRGFDCSGFVQYVYNKKGKQLPRTAAQQSQIGKSVRKSDLREGDLLFFSSGGKINHVGIVVSKKGEELTMIHSGSSTGVVITEVNKSDYWRKRWKKSRRLP